MSWLGSKKGGRLALGGQVGLDDALQEPSVGELQVVAVDRKEVEPSRRVQLRQAEPVLLRASGRMISSFAYACRVACACVVSCCVVPPCTASSCAEEGFACPVLARRTRTTRSRAPAPSNPVKRSNDY